MQSLKRALLLSIERRPFTLLQHKREFCAPTSVSQGEYETHSNESLEKLYSYFDTFPENYNVAKDYDVSYAMGVLNVVVSSKIGTYVINKQSPNRQIWLSSPFSGPKRYDLIDQRWIYQRENETLDTLLTREFRKIYGSDDINFSKHI